MRSRAALIVGPLLLLAGIGAGLVLPGNVEAVVVPLAALLTSASLGLMSSGTKRQPLGVATGLFAGPVAGVVYGAASDDASVAEIAVAAASLVFVLVAWIRPDRKTFFLLALLQMCLLIVLGMRGMERGELELTALSAAFVFVGLAALWQTSGPETNPPAQGAPVNALSTAGHSR